MTHRCVHCEGGWRAEALDHEELPDLDPEEGVGTDPRDFPRLFLSSELKETVLHPDGIRHREACGRDGKAQ